MPERCPVCGTPQFVLVDLYDGHGWRCSDWAACLLAQESRPPLPTEGADWFGEWDGQDVD